MTFTYSLAGPSSFTTNSAGGLTEQMHLIILLTIYAYIFICVCVCVCVYIIYIYTNCGNKTLVYKDKNKYFGPITR